MTITEPTTSRRAATRSTAASSGTSDNLPADRRRRPLPFAARWFLTGFAFPPSGYLAINVVAVDSPVNAIVGGAIVGAGIGTGQWLALRSVDATRGFRTRWIGATTVAMAAGLALGSAAVDYRTATSDLVVMGLLTGAVLGPVQAGVLRHARLVSRAGAVIWAATVAALWALGWFVTASAGIDVERQYSVFGATGALTCSAIGALVLSRLITRNTTSPISQPGATPS